MLVSFAIDPPLDGVTFGFDWNASGIEIASAATATGLFPVTEYSVNVMALKPRAVTLVAAAAAGIRPGGGRTARGGGAPCLFSSCAPDQSLQCPCQAGP